MSNLYNEEDEKYKDVINALKGLKKVDSPEDFELNLFREINAHKHHRKNRFFFGVLPRFTLIPATVVFTTLVIAVVIIFNQSKEEVPVSTQSTKPSAESAPPVVTPQPEVTDKKASPVLTPKTNRKEEYSAPQEQEITSTARAKTETQKTTAVEAEGTGAPAISTDNVISTARQSDSGAVFEKAGKVTKKDTLKKKKEELK